VGQFYDQRPSASRRPPLVNALDAVQPKAQSLAADYPAAATQIGAVVSAVMALNNELNSVPQGARCLAQSFRWRCLGGTPASAPLSPVAILSDAVV